MSFLETVNSLINDGYECALTMEKCNIFAEASLREYNINCQEAALKVFKESGTDDDLAYLQEAAKEGVVVKLKKAIQKMVIALKEYIAKVVDKIKVTFASKKAQATLKKIEEVSKTNPKAKKIKIQVHDIDKDQRAIDEAISKLNAQQSKIKGGASRDKIAKDIDDINDTCEKKRNKILAAATLTLTLGAAALLLQKYLAKTTTDKVYDYIEGDIDKDFDPDPYDEEQAQLIYKLMTMKLTMARKKISSIVTFMTELWGKMQGKVSVNNPFNGYADEDDDEYESANDIEILTPDSNGNASTVYTENDIIDDKEVTESVDIEDIYNSIENEVLESASDDDTDATLDIMLDVMESNLTNTSNDDEIVENATSELDNYLDILESTIATENNEESSLDDMLDDLSASL
jgi:hypothetical protein